MALYWKKIEKAFISSVRLLDPSEWKILLNILQCLKHIKVQIIIVQQHTNSLIRHA